jgi:hypothetical protein
MFNDFVIVEVDDCRHVDHDWNLHGQHKNVYSASKPAISSPPTYKCNKPAVSRKKKTDTSWK